MDSKEREAKDHEYEEFVYGQVVRYGDLHAKASKVYIACAIACVVMGVAGLVLRKPFLACICVAAWSLGFMAAKKFYEEAAGDIEKAAADIRAAIDDPDFDIPDDYPDDILSLRDLVCPIMKNIRAQVIAYGLLSLSCWAATAVLMMVATNSGFSIGYFLVTLIMGTMSLMLTVLTIRCCKDIPIARSYEEYLNAVANDEI